MLIDTSQTREVDRRLDPSQSIERIWTRFWSGQLVYAYRQAYYYGKVDEVAALVAFVASNESSYIAGANLTVDGGTNA